MERKSVSSSSLALFAAVLCACAAALAACDVSPDMAKFFNDKIGPLIGMKLQVDPNRPKPQQAKDVSSSAPVKEVDFRAVNADFIREMYRVVLLREVRQEEFARAMNALDQGGHYEALYNGIIYAEEFRDKEKGVAPVGALKAFSEILAQLSLDQKFDPLKIDAPGSAPTDEIKPPQPTEADRQGLVEDIEKDAITKSTWYMKRKLGEEILKTIDLKKEYREKLATWYGHFTVQLNKRGIDFGLAERDKTDEYFHYKWALEIDEDRLKWECLNRIHRILNAGAGLREPAPPAQVAPVPPPAQTQTQAPPAPAPAGGGQAK